MSRLLVVGNFFFHVPWFEQVRVWSNSAGAPDAVVVTGNMLGMFTPVKGERQERFLRTWIVNQNRPVFWSRGGWDYSAEEMRAWGLRNLHLAGTHELGGWRIEVMDSCGQGSPAVPSTLPTAVVSHYAPLGTKCGVGLDGVEAGSAQVRYDLEPLGNARVLMCGNVFDPLAPTDYAEGVFCCNPGVSYWEHRPQPAIALVDLDRRSVQVDSGRRSATFSFAK